LANVAFFASFLVKQKRRNKTVIIMRFTIALAIFLATSAATHAQSPARYAAYKALVETYGSVLPRGTHYIIQTDSGTGIADSLGRVLLEPRHRWSTYSGSTTTGPGGWHEFTRPGWAAVADGDFNILQSGPYERYWTLDAERKLFFVFAQKGKGGVRTRNGRWLVPPLYDAVHNFDPFRWPLVLLSKDGRAGAVDTATSREVILFRFDRLSHQRPYVVAHTADSVHLYDTTGRFIAALPYHDIRAFDGHTIAERYGSWALLDPKTLRPLTDFVYAEISTLNNPRYVAFKKDRDFEGVMNTRARVVIPDQYDHLDATGDGGFVGYAWLKYTAYNRDAELVVQPFENRHIQPVTIDHQRQIVVPDWLLVTAPRGSAYSDDDQKAFLYNTRLKKTFPYRLNSGDNYYRNAVFFGGALMEVVSLDGKDTSLMRRSGKLLKLDYAQVQETMLGALRVVARDRRVGMLDSAGKWILKPEWDDVVALGSGFFAVAKNRASPAPYYVVQPTEGTSYSIVRPAGCVGVVDSFRTPPTAWGTGYLAQSTGGWGILNNQFQVVVPMIYDNRPQPVTDGAIHRADSSLYLVQQGGRAGVVGADGRTIIPPVWARVELYNGAFMLMDSAKRLAVARRDGHITTPFMQVPMYPVLNPFGDAVVRTDAGQWGVLAHTGDTLLPFVYDTAGVYYISGQAHWWLRRGGNYTVLNSAGRAFAEGLSCAPTEVDFTRGVVVCDTGRRYVRAGGTWRLETGSAYGAPLPAHYFPNDAHFAGQSHADRARRAGFYNRAGRRIAGFPPRVGSYDRVYSGTLLLLPDAAARRFAVMDTAGRTVLPYTAADSFWLLPHAAIAAYASPRRYVVHHLAAAGRKPDTVFNISSGHDRMFRGNDGSRGGSVHFAALPNWGSKSGSVLWYTAAGTGLLDIARELDTFLPGLEAKPWHMQYDPASGVYDHLLARPIGSRTWGVFSTKDFTWRIPPELDTIWFEGQTFRFRQEGKIGLRGVEDLDVIIPAVWDTIYADGGGQGRAATYWIAKRGGQYSIVARGGRAISDGWDALANWGGRLYLRGMRGGQEYLVYPAADGRIAYEPYTKPEPGWDGGGTPRVHQFKRGEKWGVYNAALRIVAVPAKYDHIDNEEPFYAAYDLDSPDCGVWVYNEAGQLKFKLPCGVGLRYDYSGRWEVSGYAKATALDTAGRILVPAGYDEVEPLTDGIFAVEKGGKWGIISPEGKVLLPIEWDEISDDLHGPVATRGEQTCLLDIRGTRIRTHCYDEVIPDGYDRSTRQFLWVARKGEKWGRVNQQGKVLKPFRYANYEEVAESMQGSASSD